MFDCSANLEYKDITNITDLSKWTELLMPGNEHKITERNINLRVATHEIQKWNDLWKSFFTSLVNYTKQQHNELELNLEILEDNPFVMSLLINLLNSKECQTSVKVRVCSEKPNLKNWKQLAKYLSVDNKVELLELNFMGVNLMRESYEDKNICFSCNVL